MAGDCNWARDWWRDCERDEGQGWRLQKAQILSGGASYFSNFAVFLYWLFHHCHTKIISQELDLKQGWPGTWVYAVLWHMIMVVSFVQLLVCVFACLLLLKCAAFIPCGLHKFPTKWYCCLHALSCIPLKLLLHTTYFASYVGAYPRPHGRVNNVSCFIFEQ